MTNLGFNKKDLRTLAQMVKSINEGSAILFYTKNGKAPKWIWTKLDENGNKLVCLQK